MNASITQMFFVGVPLNPHIEKYFENHHEKVDEYVTRTTGIENFKALMIFNTRHSVDE